MFQSVRQGAFLYTKMVKKNENCPLRYNENETKVKMLMISFSLYNSLTVQFFYFFSMAELLQKNKFILSYPFLFLIRYT